ncbi:Transposase IS66 family protein [Variovorax sp. OK212]|nr:Transposase IS66 family protein [Variovorax sp. OK202]SFE74478.1 Transposase IS66 family protein [Variovorax sp. OK212]
MTWLRAYQSASESGESDSTMDKIVLAKRWIKAFDAARTAGFRDLVTRTEPILQCVPCEGGYLTPRRFLRARERTHKVVVEAACLAHARRKFVELHTTNKSQAAEALHAWTSDKLPQASAMQAKADARHDPRTVRDRRRNGSLVA